MRYLLHAVNWAYAAYAAALPGYRAACVALGLDADRCAAVGVGAVPACC